MKETELEKLKRLRLPKIKGTWEEIRNFINTFSEDTNYCVGTRGFVIKFKGVTKPDFYTTYYFTEKNIDKLILIKVSGCFMEPGECGSIRMSDSHHYIWELIQIPFDCGVDIKKLRNTHNIKITDRKQHEYY